MDRMGKVPSLNRPFLAGFWLFLTIPLAALVVFLLENFIHRARIEEIVGLPVLLAIGILTAYGWSATLAKRSGLSRDLVFNMAGAISFPALIMGVYAGFEPIFDWIFTVFNINQTDDGTHAEFMIVFVVWTGLVAGGSGFALGLARKDLKLAVRLLALGFSAGALTFLLVVLLMEYFGFRVGVPREDGIPSMPLVTLLGIWSAAFLGSELFGRLLNKSIDLGAQ